MKPELRLMDPTDGKEVGLGTAKNVTRFRRQQGIGGVMILAGIIGDELVGPIRVPEGVKIPFTAYCQLLESALLPWLENVPLLKRCKLIFQQDNAHPIQQRQQKYSCHR